MFHAEAVAQRGDGLKRIFFRSSVKLPNIDQCPRCRGTDRSRQLHEGYAIAKFHCDRCDKDWWS